MIRGTLLCCPCGRCKWTWNKRSNWFSRNG